MTVEILAPGDRRAARATPDPRAVWPALVLLAVVAGAALIGSEWVFFVTKPSFMSALPWLARLGVLAACAAAVSLAAVIPVLALWGLARLAGRSRLATPLRWAGRLVPAAVLAATGLLLVDNFTITLLSVGIPSTRGGGRFVYWAVAAVLLAAALGLVAERERELRSARGAATGALWSVVAAVIVVVVTVAAGARHAREPAAVAASAATSPNVLLVGLDGVNAEQTSVYGGAVDTTPFLERFAAQALLCEDAYTNCAHTTGSLVSILTGKLPTTTRVVYNPDILRGEHAYQHLPGILRRRGYRSISMSIRAFADPYDLGMRESFDEANFRRAPELGLGRATAALGPSPGYFLAQVLSRIGERLAHVFAGRLMEDAYRAVSTLDPTHRNDGERVDEVIRFVGAGRGPFFAHIHLLGTHGPNFAPRRRVFSAGREPSRFEPSWLADAILDSDTRIGELVDALEARGELERTVVVVYSDHGTRYQVGVRLPLMFRIPGRTGGERLRGPVQNLDIAPTVLDALGLPVPGWMEGRSVLRDAPDPCRWLVATASSGAVPVAEGLWAAPLDPRFGTLRVLHLASGNTSFRFDLVRGRRRREAWPGTADCAGARPERAAEQAGAALARGGFERAAVEEALRTLAPTDVSRPPGTP